MDQTKPKCEVCFSSFTLIAKEASKFPCPLRVTALHLRANITTVIEHFMDMKSCHKSNGSYPH